MAEDFGVTSAFWNFIAPDDLLLMTGKLTDRLVRYGDREGTLHEKFAEPWFFQWLVGWQPLSWFRLAATHTAMAATASQLRLLQVPGAGLGWPGGEERQQLEQRRRANKRAMMVR